MRLPAKRGTLGHLFGPSPATDGARHDINRFFKESPMIRSLPLGRFAAIALVSLVMAACAGQKEPAQKAVADLGAALDKISEIGGKYMPEELATVQAQVDGLKASFDKGDYDAVVQGAPAAATAIRQLQADSIIAKAAYAKQMNAEWVETAKAMPDVVASVDKQITRYTSSGRLPKGLDREAFKQTVATFDEAKKAWTTAAEAGNAGKYEEAVLQSREVKKTVDAVMQSLGMAAS
jgi:hypothetical protein